MGQYPDNCRLLQVNKLAVLTKSWRQAASTQHCSPVLSIPSLHGNLYDDIKDVMSSFCGSAATTAPRNVKAATQTFDSV